MHTHMHMRPIKLELDEFCASVCVSDRLHVQSSLPK